MLGEDEQLQRDEELARQIQHDEYRQLLPIYRYRNRSENPNSDLNQNSQDQQIRQNVIEATRDIGAESGKILVCRIIISLIEVIATTTILAIGWNEPCTEPLKYWILMFSARNFIMTPLHIYIYKKRNNINAHNIIDIQTNVNSNNNNNNNMDNNIVIPNQQIQPSQPELQPLPSSTAFQPAHLLRLMNILTFVLFLIGQSFLFTGKSCENTSPTVWYYCFVVIIIAYISLASPCLIILGICICLPCVLVILRYFASESQGANAQIIKKLPTKKYDVNDPSNTDPSCAVCIQEYKNGDELKILPCHHEFHKECVDRWLSMKKICPLCRHDITQPTLENVENPTDQTSSLQLTQNSNNNGKGLAQA